MPEGAPRPDTRPHSRTVEHHHAVREDLGLSPELLASWALRRAHRGGVAKSGDQYVDHGRLRLSHLARTFAELTEAGLLTLADEDPWGLRRLSLTETGHAHYAHLTTRRMRLSVPEPEFPHQTPAGRRSSCPDPLDAPGGQPDPGNTMVRTPTEMTDSDPRDSVADIVACLQWRDVDGTPIPLGCRIEQIAVSQQHGAMPSRLHQHGQVIVRDPHWLHVRFDDDRRLVILRPHLVRVLDRGPGGD